MVLLVYLLLSWFTMLWESLSRMRKVLCGEKPSPGWVLRRKPTPCQLCERPILKMDVPAPNWLIPADIYGTEIHYPHLALSKLQIDEKIYIYHHCGSKSLRFGVVCYIRGTMTKHNHIIYFCSLAKTCSHTHTHKKPITAHRFHHKKISLDVIKMLKIHFQKEKFFFKLTLYK